MIYHVTYQDAWAHALETGYYEAPSLHSEGFIHTSRKEQVATVLNRYYRNTKNLLVLHIDESRLTSPLKYELAISVNELFPHIYGPVNIESVIKTESI